MMAAYFMLSGGLFLIVAMALVVVVQPDGAEQ